ncbi:MAG: hypothetical protein ABIR24_10970 [Verrucomicrobiota bacterium]
MFFPVSVGREVTGGLAFSPRVAQLSFGGGFTRMGFFFAIALLALSCWSVFSTFRRLRRAHVSRRWWTAFALLAIAGSAAGIWLAFSFEYQITPKMRYASFPMPLAFFHLEDGHWVDFVTPPHVMYPGLIANVVAVIALALMPLFVASVIIESKKKSA